MKVLIGYDGSESGNAIFEDLQNAGLPRESDALIVSVADLLSFDPGDSAADLQPPASRRVEAVLKLVEAHRESVIKETKDLAASAADRIRTQFPEWKIEDRILVGTPAWELITAANDWIADLIVVGSQGRSALGRFFLGSVSKRISTDARCSVRVARSAGPKDADGPTRIIVGVDGSPAAEEAIYAVGHRVWQSGTEVRLLAVDEEPAPLGLAARLPQVAAMINSYLQTKETRVSSMLDWAVKELNNVCLKTEVLTEKGDPKSVLIEAARDWNADCIFVGTRDFNSTFERFRLGSVSTAVVTNAPCSVEIVRPLDRLD